MARKPRDDSAAGRQALAEKARADSVPPLPFGMTFDEENPELHRQEFSALCKLRPPGGWNEEELRHLLTVCILNRELADAIYNRDWTTANQIMNLANCVNRQLGVLTQARDQAQNRREADKIEQMKSIIGNDPDCVD